MKSTVHTCYSQNLNEEKPLKCNCRKKISLSEATRKVESGFAQWVILSTTPVTGMEICLICQNGQTKKGCQHCKGLGEIEKTYPIHKYSSDIVLVTAGSPDDKGLMVFKPVKAKQTPRTATIEEEHILRAYVNNNEEEQSRIEIYGRMILESRLEMGVGVEPPDDPVTATGRKYDIGKAPYGKISDERTNSGKVGSRITTGFGLLDPYETDPDYK